MILSRTQSLPVYATCRPDPRQSEYHRTPQKTTRTLPPLPDFHNPFPPAPFITQKTERLFTLFEKADAETKTSLEATVQYVESHFRTLAEIARCQHRRALYIHPDKDLNPRPFHIQVFINKKNQPYFYLLPKIRFLGKGKFKQVWTAIDYNRETNIACATIFPNEQETIEESLAEFRIQKRFKQADNWFLLDQGMKREKILIMMPLADGGSFGNCTNPAGHSEFFNTYSHEERENILRQILAYVSTIHDAGYVIADIKPENLLMSSANGRQEIRITDFGLSYLAADENADQCVGTPSYMGPEFLEIYYDAPFNPLIGLQSDVYALGLSLWEIFVGGTPPWLLDIPLKGFWPHPDHYRCAWKKARGYTRGSIEKLIHRMMHPVPRRRPSLKHILENTPAFHFSDPSFEGIRLLTPKESRSRFQHNQQALDNNLGGYPTQQVYTLTQDKSRKHFYIVTNEYNIKVKPIHNRQVRIYLDKNHYRTYPTLEEYLAKYGLSVCLNFNAY
jgi:serine/threonine protein kinase